MGGDVRPCFTSFQCHPLSQARLSGAARFPGSSEPPPISSIIDSSSTMADPDLFPRQPPSPQRALIVSRPPVLELIAVGRGVRCSGRLSTVSTGHGQDPYTIGPGLYQIRGLLWRLSGSGKRGIGQCSGWQVDRTSLFVKLTTAAAFFVTYEGLKAQLPKFTSIQSTSSWNHLISATGAEFVRRYLGMNLMPGIMSDPCSDRGCQVAYASGNLWTGQILDTFGNDDRQAGRPERFLPRVWDHNSQRGESNIPLPGCR
jgi:hypothetical protein